MDSGWIRLHRKIRDNPLWPKSRRFTPLEAWLDVLMSANHTPAKTLLGISTLVSVERGQFITSQVKLAERWRWNRKTVSGFLSILKKDEMLDFDTSRGADIGFTRITIRNYSKYQDKEDDTLDIEIGSKGTFDGQSNGHLLVNNKNVKKGKKKNTRSSPTGSTNGDGASELSLAESFDVFWQAYPRKVAKEAAGKAWGKLKSTPELLNTILTDIGRRIKTREWRREEKEYIPYPASYLNGNRWEDETETEEVENPYAHWPVLVDCQTCGDAHNQGETCPNAAKAMP